MGFLAGKRILITGLLSNRSIAYGIAKACRREGAELAFTYQSDRFKERVVKFGEEFDSQAVFPCDVADDQQITDLFVALAQHWDGLDGLVHSIAFAPNEAIEGDFLDGITRDAFRIAHDISSYSYPALVKAARPLLLKGNNAATLALTYLGDHQKQAIEDLSTDWNVAAILPCDVTRDEDLAAREYCDCQMGRELRRVDGRPLVEANAPPPASMC